jgi:hypothetical protein
MIGNDRHIHFILKIITLLENDEEKEVVIAAA